MNSSKRPSIVRVIQTDYYAFMASIFPVILWAFYLFDFLGQRPTGEGTFPYVTLGFTALGVLVALWRYLSIRRLFDDGLEVPARVEDLILFRGRGRVAYSFTQAGEKRLNTNMVMKHARVEALEPGSAVTALVDRENPKRSVIRELYLP